MLLPMQRSTSSSGRIVEAPAMVYEWRCALQSGDVMEVCVRAQTPMTLLGSVVTLAIVLLGIYFVERTPDPHFARRIVAIGDLHGDYDHALAILRHTDIIGTNTTDWIAGKDILVNTGDTVDRGNDTVKVYQLFQSLREQSAKMGGQVITLLGNHEMMNAMHDWSYVAPGDIESFGGAEARRKAISTDGWLGKEWLHHYNVTASVRLLPKEACKYGPMDAAVFVHGGITPEWAAIGTDTINALGHSLLSKALADPNSSGALPANTTDEERSLWERSGPFRYRGYALEKNETACPTIKTALDTLGYDHMVMGHTPQMDGIVKRCNGTGILIDTGISSVYGGKQSALVFESELGAGWTQSNDGSKVYDRYWAAYHRISAHQLGEPARVLNRVYYVHPWKKPADQGLRSWFGL